MKSAFFEALLKKGADTHEIGQCIQSIAWLQSELTQIFNQYGYLQDTAVVVSDPMLIIHYMGLENVRLWVGYLCNRRWLPLKSFRLHHKPSRTLSYQTAHALAVRRLARHHQLSVDAMYLATVLHNSGASTLLWVAAKVAEQCWSRWLRDAERIKENALYETILLSKFPVHIISNLWLKYYNHVNNCIFENLQWQPSNALDLVKELNTGKTFADLSATSQLIKKGSCYAKFYLLNQWNIKHAHPKEKIFQFYQITPGEIEALQEINFHKLPITQ